LIQWEGRGCLSVHRGLGDPGDVEKKIDIERVDKKKTSPCRPLLQQCVSDSLAQVRVEKKQVNKGNAQLERGKSENTGKPKFVSHYAKDRHQKKKKKHEKLGQIKEHKGKTERGAKSHYQRPTDCGV